MRTPTAIRNDLKAIWEAVEMRLPRSLVGLWCRHPAMYVPVVPLMGPAPYKQCPRCGHKQVLTSEDYRDPSRLNLISVTGVVIDMNGRHQDEDMAKRMGL